jgi:hypothetical protein
MVYWKFLEPENARVKSKIEGINRAGIRGWSKVDQPVMTKGWLV